MGVPGYFRELIKHYPHIVRQKVDKIDSLYIDANCLFHPVCFQTLDENINDTVPNSLFDKMVANILKYIDNLLKFANPTKLLYIAVDGVAPVAKINQQRKRRFGYAHDYRRKIYRKHNIPSNSSWSNIVITPGTEFMFNLHLKISEFCANKVKDCPENFEIIYDPYLIAGEGEHKIVHHIKNNSVASGSFAIYGLDADLIFLAMSCQLPNLYLLRESSAILQISDSATSSADDNLIYVDVDVLKQCIVQDMRKYISHNIDEKMLINDYIFVCYFLGNDFIPHLPSIDIKVNGYITVVNAYTHVYNKFKHNLISVSKSSLTIDELFLQEFLDTLASFEQEYFQKDLRLYLSKHSKRSCPETDPHKKEIWHIDNLKCIDMLDVVNPTDSVVLGQGDPSVWKASYYSYYFKTPNCDNICHNYLEGILWVTKYYFDLCNNWTWQYKYTHPPFISDVAAYLRTHNIMKDFDQPATLPLSIPVQLVSVVHPIFSKILPCELRELITSDDSPIVDMYPISYKIDILNKTQFYTCIPIIPYLDTDRVQAAVVSVKLLDITQRFESLNSPLFFANIVKKIAKKTKK